MVAKAMKSTKQTLASRPRAATPKARRSPSGATAKKGKRKVKTKANAGSTAKKASAPAAVTRTAALARLLPKSVGELSYVERTIRILEQGERSRKRLRRKQVLQLKQVFTDLQRDVTDRVNAVEVTTRKQVGDLSGRVKSTSMVQRATDLPERVVGAVDYCLNRVGLVRKARVETGRKRRPARRRKAA